MALAPPPLTEPPKPIDRETTVPFHIKVFYRQNSFPRLDEFSPSAPSLPAHISLHTWPSCTLRELSHLLTSDLLSSHPNFLPSPIIGTRLSYRLLYPDTRDAAARPGAPGRYLSKDLGSCIVRPEKEEQTERINGAADKAEDGAEAEVDDATKTLQDARFVVGDYIAVAILPPFPDGSIAPPLLAGGFGVDTGIRGGRGGIAAGAGRGFAAGLRGALQQNGSGFQVRGRGGGVGDAGVRMPEGEWRRGERVPEPVGGGGRGRYFDRGRGRRW